MYVRQHSFHALNISAAFRRNLLSRLDSSSCRSTTAVSSIATYIQSKSRVCGRGHQNPTLLYQIAIRDYGRSQAFTVRSFLDTAQRATLTYGRYLPLCLRNKGTLTIYRIRSQISSRHQVPTYSVYVTPNYELGNKSKRNRRTMCFS